MTMLYSALPMTTDVSSPYFGIGLVGVLAMVAVGAYGAYVAAAEPRKGALAR